MNGVDHKAILAFKKGKIKGFETIYRTYSGKVYGFIFSIINNSDVAKDLTHDIFMHMWEKRENIDCEGSFEGYLFIVSRNMVYHYIKRELLMQRYIDKEQLTRQETLDPEKELDYAFFENYILQLISELPEARRKVFMLYWKSDYSYKEIANELSISEKTVATQVQRSLHFLRSKMGNAALSAILLLYAV